ncbi:hypothetical protein N3K66_006245 [Trichothecium roseum]|uniref:Uncharacterized protein n=1 Tax=Trichothecium roseum TaxID=47278 RepID=A0ACC0V042_9HYPO|nr:hypothetical protein N3K66_006245 [Trichothecium roseum]
MATKEFTLQEVARHNTRKDIYVVIDEEVYDASTMIEDHPGGMEILMEVAGTDATEPFYGVGHSDDAKEELKGIKVGNLKRLPGDPKLGEALPAQDPVSVPAKESHHPEQGGGSLASYTLILVAAVLATSYGAAHQYIWKV